MARASKGLHLAGVSALALIASVAAAQVASACEATADQTIVPAGADDTTVTTNFVNVSCDPGSNNTLFNTTIAAGTGSSSTGSGTATYFAYDGNGADVLNLIGADISNVSGDVPPPVVNAYSGASLGASAGNIETLGGNDTVNISDGVSGTVTFIEGGIDLGAGNDTFNMTGGTTTGSSGATIAGSLFGDGAAAIQGNDTFTITGGTVGGSIFAGGGNDQVLIGGTATIGAAAGGPDSVGLEDGDDIFTMTGGSTSGSVSGGAGNDTFELSGGTIGTFVNGGTGNDVYRISGTANVTQQVTDEGGDNTFEMSGGTVGTLVNLGPGNNTVAVSGGTIGEALLTGDGNAQITVTGGAIGGGIVVGTGQNVVQVSGGTVGNGSLGVLGGAGGDTITVSGTAVVNGQLSGGLGDNAITVAGGTINGGIDAAGGSDTVTIGGGSIRDGVNVGGGDNTISMTGGTVGQALFASGGANTFNLSGGTIGGTSGGGVFGGAGVERINISGNVVVNGQIAPGDGDDIITIAGGTVTSFIVGGAGNDTVTISGGTMNGYIDLNDGNDTLTMTGGTLNNHIEGNGGNDTITIAGGFIRDFVYGNQGDDIINVSGGTVGGNVDGGDGTDRITVSGGTIRGNVIGETVHLNGGTIDGDILGLSANTLVINSGSALTLRNGVLFSGTNAVGTITGSDLARSSAPGVFQNQVFAGFQSLTLSGSTLGFASGPQGIANLFVNNGSTLYAAGNVNLQGNLSVVNATVDMLNNSPTDVLNVANLTLNNATIRIDANQQAGLADEIANAGTLAASGTNVFFVNLIGTPVLNATSILPISPVTGETVDPNATASQNFVVQGINNTTGALFTYDVIFGSDGGVYLRSRNADFVSPQAMKVAIDYTPVETATNALYDILADAIAGNSGLGQSNRQGSAFGVYASGQLAQTRHDGFRISNSTFSGVGPSFQANEFSLAGSVELNAAEYFGFDKSIGLDIGAFGGYARSDVTLDPTSVFANLGDASNNSAMFGGYSLLRKGTTYGLVAATTFFGSTDINNRVLQATGSYDTLGYAVAGTVGHVFALSDVWRFDLRGGVMGVTFRGDAFTDSGGTAFGKSELSFGAFKFEPGFFAQYVLEDGKVLSPYIRTEFQQRFAYSNKGSIDGVGFEFDDADFSAAVAAGVNYKISDMSTLSTELRGKLSADSSTFSGKLGYKARF
jgi:hypothetical protein